MAETWEELDGKVQKYLNTGEPLAASRLIFEMLGELHARYLEMQEELKRLKGKVGNGDQDEGLPTLPEPSSGDSSPFVHTAGSEPAPASSCDSVAGRIASG